MRAGAPRDAHSGAHPQAGGVMLACPAMVPTVLPLAPRPSGRRECGPRPEPMDSTGSASGWGPTPLTLGLAQTAEGHPGRLLSDGSPRAGPLPAHSLAWPPPALGVPRGLTQQAARCCREGAEQGRPRSAAPRRLRCGRPWIRWSGGTSTRARWYWRYWRGAGLFPPRSPGPHQPHPRTPAPWRPRRGTLGRGQPWLRLWEPWPHTSLPERPCPPPPKHAPWKEGMRV